MFVHRVHIRYMDTEWFRARKAELKLTDAEIGAVIGRDRSVANRLINGRLGFDIAWVPALMQLFEVSRDELLTRVGAGPSASEPAPEANALTIPMEGASEERMRENLPVYGTALGAARRVDGDAVEQTTLNRGEIVQYAKRPVLLNGRSDAYGLYVQGSSMYPAHADGSMVVVAPRMPIRIGDDVVVYLRPNDPAEDNGEAARAVLLKRVVRRTSTFMELEQFNPPKVFRIDMEEVVRVDRVLTLTEMLN